MEDTTCAEPRIPVLVITGSVGVGKSSVAAAIAEHLTELRLPHALIDMDWLRECAPAPLGDPFHTTLGLQNLAAVAINYRAAGARCLILVDVVEDAAMTAAYAAAIPGAAVTVVRLAAPLAIIEERLRGRHPPGTQLDWHLERAAELVSQMERARVEHLVIDTASHTIDAIAMTILMQVPSFVP